MTKSPTYKPSGFVIWRQSKDGLRWDLRKLGTATTFVDQAPLRYGGAPVPNARWTATVRFEPMGSDATPYDVDARAWTCVTQGPDSGGRRYRYHLTFADAQNAALAWLDRRFVVIGVDDEIVEVAS